MQPPSQKSHLSSRSSSFMALSLLSELETWRALASPSLPPIQREWGDWLGPFPWIWFVTATFANPVHPEQARKRWGRWIHDLEAYEWRWPLRPIIWAVGWERQRRGVLHIHALVARVEDVPSFVAMRRWERIGGGYARIVTYDPAKGAAYYIAKGGDVELSPVWFES